MEEQPVWLIALIFVLFVLLPIGFIWSGIKLAYSNFRFRKSAVLVIGKVVEADDTASQIEEEAARTFRPVFEFKNQAGDLLRGKSVSRLVRDSFPLHSEHEIQVNFHAPETVQIYGDRIYLKAIAMVAISGVILFAGGRFMLSLS